MTGKRKQSDPPISPPTLRERADKRVTAAPTDLAKMSSADIQRLVHELQIHQIELELQNEELRQSQLALAESRDEYSDLYDFAPVGYVSLDENGKILATNLAAATMLGCDRKKLLKLRFTQFVRRESQDDWHRYREAIFGSSRRSRQTLEESPPHPASGQTRPDHSQSLATSAKPEYFDSKQMCELQMLKADGTPLALHLESIAFDMHGKRQCQMALIDVTKRRDAEQALSASEATLRSLLNNVPSLMGIVELAPDGLDILHILDNPETERFFGVSSGGTVRRWAIRDLGKTPEPTSQWIAAYRRAKQSGTPARFEYQSYHRAPASQSDPGQTRASSATSPPLWLDVSVSYIGAGDEGRDRFCYVATDISERKQAEEALRTEHARTELLARVVSKLLTAADPQTVVEELCNEVREFLHCAVFFNYLLDPRLERLQFNACGGVDPRVARLVEGLELSGSLCGTAARDHCRVLAENLTTTFDDRSKVVRSMGVRAYACHPLLEPGDQAFGTLSFGATDRDEFSAEDLALMKSVTDHVAIAMLRYRAKEALRQSEEQFRHALEESPIPVIMHAEDGQVLQISRTWTELTGYQPEDIPTFEAWLNRAYGEGAEAVRRHVRELFNGNRKTINIEFPVRTRDDRTRHWSFSASAPGILADGRRYVVGMALDITESREAKAAIQKLNATLEQQIAERTTALRVREERTRAILDTAFSAIVTIDRQGIIIESNLAAERMFGYREDELIGQNVNILMPPPHCDDHDQYIARYLRTGETRIIGGGVRELIARRKDGSTFPIEIAITEVDHLGLFTGVMYNISERKALQQHVLEIAAEEQRRIGQELHDGTQQELTGLSLMAGTLMETLSSIPEERMGTGSSWRFGQGTYSRLSGITMKLNQGLASAAKKVREIAHGIMPVQIDAQGLLSAIEELASATNNTSGINCRFDCRHPVVVANNTVASHLYRIAQESVTNALRHSHATEIVMSLVQTNGYVELAVCDNGRGFDPALIGATTNSAQQHLGLRIMEYRANLIGGTLRIERAESGGTIVRCLVPRGEDFA